MYVQLPFVRNNGAFYCLNKYDISGICTDDHNKFLNTIFLLNLNVSIKEVISLYLSISSK